MELIVIVLLLLGIAIAANLLLVGILSAEPGVAVFVLAAVGLVATVRGGITYGKKLWKYVRETYLTRTVVRERTVVKDRIVEKEVVLVDREVQLRTMLKYMPGPEEEKEELFNCMMDNLRAHGVVPPKVDES